MSDALDQRAVTRIVGLLSLGGFASSAAMRVCDPMLPRFADDFQASLAAVASVNTGFAISYGLLQLGIGPLGDRLGKFRVITVAMMLAALASIACALAPSLHGLVAARVMAGGMGGAIIPVAFAWIGDQVPYVARQSVLARVMSGSLIGVICGQLIGGICVDTVGWRWAFVVLAALFGIVAILMRTSPAARLRPAPAMDAGDTGLRSVLRNYASIARPAWSRMILGAVMIEALIMYGGLSFIPTTLHDRFGIPLWQAAMISAVMGVGGFVYTLLAARLIGRLGEQRLVVVGGTMVCAGLMLVAVAPYPWLAAVGTGALGLGFYGFHNTLQVHGTQLSPTHRGMGVALFALCLFIGQSIGVSLISMMVTLVGFTLSLAGAAVAFGLLTIWFSLALARHQAEQIAMQGASDSGDG